jgi:hypothetical protein|tara:strand:+ start:87 stop:683 length:597 start_codon:yes stop_codon:yes gene_type:complete
MVGHNAEKHKTTRVGQSQNVDKYHHPEEKKLQLEKYSHLITGNILEVFAGKGNLTEYYSQHGNVTALTKEEFGDSFDAIYKLRGNNKKYNVIDIDSYGYPDRSFPVVFELMKDECLLIFTFPVVGINCLNGIMEQHFITFWRSARPTIGDVTGILTDMALREWFLLQLINVQKIKRIWRFVYICKRQKATEFCGVKNR